MGASLSGSQRFKVNIRSAEEAARGSDAGTLRAAALVRARAAVAVADAAVSGRCVCESYFSMQGSCCPAPSPPWHLSTAAGPAAGCCGRQHGGQHRLHPLRLGPWRSPHGESVCVYCQGAFPASLGCGVGGPLSPLLVLRWPLECPPNRHHRSLPLACCRALPSHRCHRQCRALPLAGRWAWPPAAPAAAATWRWWQPRPRPPRWPPPLTIRLQTCLAAWAAAAAPRRSSPLLPLPANQQRLPLLLVRVGGACGCGSAA